MNQCVIHPEQHCGHPAHLHRHFCESISAEQLFGPKWWRCVARLMMQGSKCWATIQQWSVPLHKKKEVSVWFPSCPATLNVIYSREVCSGERPDDGNEFATVNKACVVPTNEKVIKGATFIIYSGGNQLFIFKAMFQVLGCCCSCSAWKFKLRVCVQTKLLCFLGHTWMLSWEYTSPLLKRQNYPVTIGAFGNWGN